MRFSLRAGILRWPGRVPLHVRLHIHDGLRRQHERPSEHCSVKRCRFGIARVDDGSGGFQVRYCVDGVLVDTNVGNATVSQPSTVPATAPVGYELAIGLPPL